MQSSKTIRPLVEAAILIAMALAISEIKFKIWPNGGSVSFVMVPLIIFALRRRTAWGIAAGAIYGVLDCIIGGGVAYGWQAIILDYVVAYACVGLAGLYRRVPAVSAVIACVARFVIHVITGVVIWGEWMPDEFLGMSMTNVWTYSFLYNATYMLPNTIIVVMVVLLLSGKRELLNVEN